MQESNQGSAALNLAVNINGNARCPKEQSKVES